MISSAAPAEALSTASLQAQLNATMSLPLPLPAVIEVAAPLAEEPEALRVFDAGGSVVSQSFCSAAKGCAFGFFELP